MTFVAFVVAVHIFAQLQFHIFNILWVPSERRNGDCFEMCLSLSWKRLTNGRKNCGASHQKDLRLPSDSGLCGIKRFVMNTELALKPSNLRLCSAFVIWTHRDGGLRKVPLHCLPTIFIPLEIFGKLHVKSFNYFEIISSNLINWLSRNLQTFDKARVAKVPAKSWIVTTKIA